MQIISKRQIKLEFTQISGCLNVETQGSRE